METVGTCRALSWVGNGTTARGVGRQGYLSWACSLSALGSHKGSGESEGRGGREPHPLAVSSAGKRDWLVAHGSHATSAGPNKHVLTQRHPDCVVGGPSEPVSRSPQ